MKQNNEKSYYERYIRQTRIFQIVGVVFMFIAIIINEFINRQMNTPVFIFAVIGALLLIIGGASARPPVMIRSFAALLENEPTKRNAEEFLEMLNHLNSVRLVNRSKIQIEMALQKYQNSTESDEKLISKIHTAIKEHIRDKLF